MIGISPSIGIFVTELPSALLISPPKIMVSAWLIIAFVFTERLVVVGLSAEVPEPGRMSSMVVSISKDTLLLEESLGLTFKVIPI